MPSTLVDVYWSARAAEHSDCTSKALAHFRLLAHTAEALDKWFLKAWRKPREPVAVDVTSAEVLAGLWRVNRRDTDRSEITELGWSLSLWNGDLGGASASTSLHCGCTAERVSNNALVQVSREDSSGLESGEAVELLKGLVELWDADTGVVTQSTWNEGEQRRVEIEIADYERRRWPVLLSKNAVRHASGVITLT